MRPGTLNLSKYAEKFMFNSMHEYAPSPFSSLGKKLIEQETPSVVHTERMIVKACVYRKISFKVPLPHILIESIHDSASEALCSCSV